MTIEKDLDWRRNLRGGDDALLGPRGASWWTGLPPVRGECPGVGADGALRGLPAPDLSSPGPDRMRDSFENAWTLTDVLFSGLAGEEAFYRPPSHELRHPLIFYYAHTAVFLVNKLRMAGLLDAPVNAEWESLFEMGVDEMSWDDLSKNHREWPRVPEVTAYRRAVRQRVLDVIERRVLPGRAITWDDPLWALPMAIEHDLIHVETSSVLVRELPARLVRPPDAWAPVPPGVREPEPRSDSANAWRQVPEGEVRLGKRPEDRTYAWDNEYGEAVVRVPRFFATERLISNAEMAEFVDDGGYREERWWSGDGWRWRGFRRAEHPAFWVTGGAAPRLRLVFESVPMAWSAPAVVNWHEASAFAAWRSAKDGVTCRLPTEAEYARLLAGGTPSANIALAWGAETPAGALAPNAWGFRDVRGNVWQWLDDVFAPLPGFRPHRLYPDYSAPAFDGQHRRMAGGSFATCGAGENVSVRNWFRPHFFQHAGFRLACSSR